MKIVYKEKLFKLKNKCKYLWTIILQD